MGRFRYNSPSFQIFLVSIIFFCSIGMFDLYKGIGGYGNFSVQTTTDASLSLAITFAVYPLIAAPVYNIFGHRIILPAILTYILYISSHLTSNSGYFIAASVFLGIGSSILWTVVDVIILSYPDEKDKGKAFSIFWMISSIGDIINNVIGLNDDWDNIPNQHIKTSTTIILMIVIFVGFLIALLLSPPGKVIRVNGSRVSIHQVSSWRREAFHTLILFKNWRLLTLIPLFASTPWSRVYGFSIYNTPSNFSLRAKSLNNFLYSLCQTISGGCFIGFLLDFNNIGSRRRRAFVGNTLALISTIALLSSCFFTQKFFNNKSNAEIIDIYDNKYPGYAIEFALLGFKSAIYDGLIYWLIGAMTNDIEHTARYSNFYKAILNTSEIISFQINANEVAPMVQLAVTFTLSIIGLLLSYIVCHSIPNTTVETIDNINGKDPSIIMVGGEIKENNVLETPMDEKIDV